VPDRPATARPTSTARSSWDNSGILQALADLARTPQRRGTVRAMLVTLVVAAICWYFGADVWHSILFGGAITTFGAVALAAAPSIDRSESISWHRENRRSSEGSRPEIARLSSRLHSAHGRVGNVAMYRVQRLAHERLARHQLDLRAGGDRLRIEELLGRRACDVLVRGERRPPTLRSLQHCLDALDALDPTLQAIASPKPRRRTLPATSHLLRRFRGR
jgi:hypothetical protein